MNDNEWILPLATFAASAVGLTWLHRTKQHKTKLRRCSAAALSSVPIIDLLSTSAVDQMRLACIHHGFFYITNHGISNELMERTFRASKKFFALPIDTKLQFAANKFNKGYTRFLEEQLDSTEQKSGDTKEGYYIGRDVMEEESPLEGPNQWPDETLLPHWKETMLEYYSEMTELGHLICRMLALTCELPENYFNPFFTKPLGALRLLHYNAQVSSPNQGLFAAGQHSDYGMITLLANDGQPGLQIYLHDRWIDVPPLENCLIVNLGDMFMRWTNDTYKSTVHRVVNVTGEERFSIPFFFEPDFHALVECLAPFCRDRPAKYSPTRYGDYLIRRYQDTHADYKA